MPTPHDPQHRPAGQPIRRPTERDEADAASIEHVPDETPRDDYEPDDPAERAGLRRPRGGRPNTHKT